MAQLVECLALTHAMLHSIHTPDFSLMIRYSITALGEMFPSVLNTAITNLHSAGREYLGRRPSFPWVARLPPARRRAGPPYDRGEGLVPERGREYPDAVPGA